MPALSYQINVVTPCPGNQVVTKIANTHYTGSNGDFTYAILTRGSQDTAWRVVVYDYSSTSTPCYPTKTFEQVTPDADDPSGVYYGLTDSGPDQSEGELSVAVWP